MRSPLGGDVCHATAVVGLLVILSAASFATAGQAQRPLTADESASASADSKWPFVPPPSLNHRELHAWDLSTVAPSTDGLEAAYQDRALELFAQQDTQAHVDQAFDAQELHATTVTEEAFDSPELPTGGPKTLWRRMLRDQVNYYSPESLLLISSGLVVGATMANTSLDRNIQSHLQSSLHHANTDEWLESLHANKEFGDGYYTLPIFAGAWVLGNLLPQTPSVELTRVWGERSLRGFLVGAPPLLALQLATGGSRPGESPHGSEWEPFQDNNGVSGHSFMGALPFITAAKMSDSIGLKAAFYAASTLAPLSRAADGAHYPSQVALGWWMAYVSATAVHMTDRPRSHWRIFPTTVASGSGMAIEYRF